MDLQSGDQTIDPSPVATSDPTNEPSASCHHCQKPATLICAGCQDTRVDDNDVQTKFYYCDATCQKEGWKTHKLTCKARRQRQQLHRGGYLAQQTFLMLQERLFSWVVTAIKTGAKEMVCSVNTPVSKDVILHPFPDNLCNRTEDKWAILSHCNSTFVMAEMVEMMEILFPGK